MRSTDKRPPRDSQVDRTSRGWFVSYRGDVVRTGAGMTLRPDAVRRLFAGTRVGSGADVCTGAGVCPGALRAGSAVLHVGICP